MKNSIILTGMINHYRMGMIPWAYKERFFKNLTFSGVLSKYQKPYELHNCIGKKENKFRVFLVTVKGIAVPCTIKKGHISSTVRGGYNILRLANEKQICYTNGWEY